MTRDQIIKNLQGIIAPVVTPFNRRGDVDEGLLRENLSRYVGIGLAGILVAGSTGEAPYLAESERLRLVEVAREVVKPPELLLVGTGLESTDATLRLSREAVARGADALLVLTPNYYKSRMDSAALVAHYRAVAAGVTRPVADLFHSAVHRPLRRSGDHRQALATAQCRRAQGKLRQAGLCARRSPQGSPGLPRAGRVSFHSL